MANTTWKQIVYDVADGIRTLLGTSDKIAINQLKGKLTGITRKAAATYTPSTSAQTIAAGQYLAGDQTISAVPTETKSVTPNSEVQTIIPSSGKFLSSVTVEAASSNIALDLTSLRIPDDSDIDIGSFVNITPTLKSTKTVYYYDDEWETLFRLTDDTYIFMGAKQATVVKITDSGVTLGTSLYLGGSGVNGSTLGFRVSDNRFIYITAGSSYSIVLCEVSDTTITTIATTSNGADSYNFFFNVVELTTGVYLTMLGSSDILKLIKVSGNSISCTNYTPTNASGTAFNGAASFVKLGENKVMLAGRTGSTGCVGILTYNNGSLSYSNITSLGSVDDEEDYTAHALMQLSENIFVYNVTSSSGYYFTYSNGTFSNIKSLPVSYICRTSSGVYQRDTNNFACWHECGITVSSTGVYDLYSGSISKVSDFDDSASEVVSLGNGAYVVADSAYSSGYYVLKVYLKCPAGNLDTTLSLGNTYSATPFLYMLPNGYLRIIAPQYSGSSYSSMKINVHDIAIETSLNARGQYGANAIISTDENNNKIAVLI